MANPLGTKIGSAFFEVTAAFTGFGDSFQAGALSSIAQAGVTLGTAMENLGKELFKKFTIPFGVAAAANVAQFQSLERALAETLTLFGTAPTQVDAAMGAMADGITEVSQAVGGLEKDLADGLYQTISAGVDKEDAFDFLSVAQMAAIADKTADVTTAVDGLTTGVNAFGLESKDVGGVADAFFATVAKGKTTFGELANDIGRVAPLAANAGVSLEETLAVIGQLTVGGLKTSESVSFLRAAITGLLRPGEEMNALFQEAGFRSAEAAVPILGLQGAFQTVVDAAGGSTSKLQELIGTSEGVTAVLGVTGEKAGEFAEVLAAVEQSAGSTQTAFDIIDGTVSRSFGKMTEAFDRLGNLFGEMGSQFAQPVVDTVTDIVDGVYEVFERLTPIAKNFGEVFGNIMSIFGNPVVRTFAVAIASIVVSFGALLGLVGALLIPLGNVIVMFFQLKTVKAIVGGLHGVLQTLWIQISQIGDALIRMGKALIGSAVPATTALGRAMKTLGRVMASPIGAFSALTLGIAAAAAAIGGAVYLWSKWRDAQREAYQQNQTFTVGIQHMAEAAGITSQALSLVADGMDDMEQSAADFTLTNQGLITEIGQVVERLGAAAAQDYILSIGSQLVFEGATPEQAIRQMQQIADALDLEIEFDTSSLDNAGKDVGALFDGVRVKAESIQTLLTEGGFGNKDGMFKEAEQEANDLSVAISKAYIAASQEGDLGAFEGMVGSALEGVENVELLSTAMGKALVLIEEASGQDLDIDLKNVKDFGDFIRELEEAGITFEDVKQIIETPIVPKPVFGSLETEFEDFDKGAKSTVEWTQAAVDSITDLRFGLDTIMEAGTAAVEEYFGTIKAQVLDQMPLLGIYEGAIEQSFAEWHKGQIKFQEDIANVTAVRQQLIDQFGEGHDVVKAFDAQPLSEQAWFAQLGGKQLETAIEDLQTSYNAGMEATTDRAQQDMNLIMDARLEAMNTKYEEMAEEAASHGRVVSDEFHKYLEEGSKDWIVTIGTTMDTISAMLGGTIPGPTIGGVTFTGGGFSPADPSKDPARGGDNHIEVNINNPTTNNLVGDTNRAVGILRTSRLTGHLE